MAGLSINREVPLSDNWDVIVIGGGPAGCTAAAASAREGAKTLLIEGTGILGGMGSAGMVPGWCGFTDQKVFIHRGLAEKIRHRLDAGTSELSLDDIKSLQRLDAEKFKRVLDELMEEFEVEVLLNTFVTEVVMDGEGKIKAVLAGNKDGLVAFAAPVFIDCSGDADVAFRAGVPTVKGDEDGDMQPVTHCFCLANVKSDNIAKAVEKTPDWAQKIIDDPEFPLIKDSFFWTGNKMTNSVHVCNNGHQWDVDGTDAASVSKALKDGREIARQFRDGMAKYLPDAFSEAFLAATAPLLGVRETRRIVGDYVLTGEDHQARRHFDDEISVNSFFIDIHPSWKNRLLEKEGKWSWKEEMQDSWLLPGETHGIPFRCLIPKGVDNLLVAGRSVSSDRIAQSAIRVMPVCMTMGEAAGVAAAEAATKHGGEVRKVDAQVLRKHLKELGAYLP